MLWEFHIGYVSANHLVARAVLALDSKSQQSLPSPSSPQCSFYRASWRGYHDVSHGPPLYSPFLPASKAAKLVTAMIHKLIDVNKEDQGGHFQSMCQVRGEKHTEDMSFMQIVV